MPTYFVCKYIHATGSCKIYDFREELSETQINIFTKITRLVIDRVKII